MGFNLPTGRYLIIIQNGELQQKRWQEFQSNTSYTHTAVGVLLCDKSGKGAFCTSQALQINREMCLEWMGHSGLCVGILLPRFKRNLVVAGFWGVDFKKNVDKDYNRVLLYFNKV